MLFISFFICGFSTNGLIQTHWITLCSDFGVAPVGAAGILALIGAFDFVGTILSGLLSDRFGRERANLTFGWILAGHQLGAATAAFGAGVTRTLSGSYLPTLYVAGVLCLLASLLVLTLGRRFEPAAAALPHRA